MPLMPGPCRLNYLSQILKLWRPPQFPLDPVRTCDQNCRVARPARHKLNGNFFAGYLASTVNNFLHTVAIAAATQVESRAALIQLVEREHMCLSQVDDVHIISD